jgi:hypothetical protein
VLVLELLAQADKAKTTAVVTTPSAKRVTKLAVNKAISY